MSDHRHKIKAGQARAGAVRRSKEGKRATRPLGAAYVPEMKRPKLSFPSQAEQPFPRSRVRYRRHARLTLPFKREAEPGRKFGADPQLVVKCEPVPSQVQPLRPRGQACQADMRSTRRRVNRGQTQPCAEMALRYGEVGAALLESR